MVERPALYLVSTPIGHLGDLTYRAAEVLREVDVIYAEDTRRTRILLRQYGIETRCVSYREHNEAVRAEEARALWSEGQSLALVADAGTPLVSDPGLRLVRAAIESRVAVVPIPGPSAVLAALVASGLEAEPFTYLGFLPRAGPARRRVLETIRGLQHTGVLFESPQRLLRTLSDLTATLGPDRTVVVARELTKIHEEFFRGRLAEAVAHFGGATVRGEVVVCVEGARAGAPTAVEQARARAAALARSGASTREIARALQKEMALDRNRAYALALEVRRRRRGSSPA
ncbi:MAG: 16S rRNA (cytidine(1402)-2'-O)-methyltransferase [Gemmatimonadetes bacterium]|nr:16S rRNA (cytidine(1402)-2'-O)-methyltransferase [Gemmatimonadota bacterium]